jgi:hypothetical protein
MPMPSELRINLILANVKKYGRRTGLRASASIAYLSLFWVLFVIMIEFF